MASAWDAKRKRAHFTILLVVLWGIIGGAGGSFWAACSSADSSPPPMDAFLKEAFSGEEGALAHAVAKYGDSAMVSEELSIFLLTHPVVLDTVTEANETVCYHVEAEAGIQHRRYRFCWKGAQLVGVEDLGMVTDE